MFTDIDGIKEFKKEHRINLIFAVSGDADTKLEKVPESDPLQKDYKRVQEERVKRIIIEFLCKFKDLNSQIAILTGGTKGGVPECATKTAKQMGFKTIGIYPASGKKYFLGDEYIDFSFCVEPVYQSPEQSFRWCTDSCWGDESSLFAKLLDAVVVIGGSSGTLIEVAYILKLNKEIKKGKTNYSRLKYIVPISGFGGVSEGIHTIWCNPDIAESSILSYTFSPDKRKSSGRIYSGIQAADVLLDTEELNIWDLY